MTENKFQALKYMWQDAGMSDPMMFSICFYEKPELIIRLFELFYPNLQIEELIGKPQSPAQFLHNCRTEPQIFMLAKTKEGDIVRIELCLTESLAGHFFFDGEYNDYLPRIQSDEISHCYNIMISTELGEDCGRPIIQVGIKSNHVFQYDLTGTLICLSDHGEITNEDVRQFLELMRGEEPEGEFVKAFLEVLHHVKYETDWMDFYIEETLYKEMLLYKQNIDRRS